MRLWAIILMPSLALAQNAAQMIAHGEQVFHQTCANGYCHVAKGAGGGAAPRLVARGFDEAYIAKVVVNGVPGAVMPAFAGKLSATDLSSVIAYVDNLNGVTPSANPGGRGGLQPGPVTTRARLTPDAEKGRSLFFEATLGFGRCSTCHQVGNQGIPVASPIAAIPADAAQLKILKTPHVSTASADGETMPVLVLSHGTKSTVFYDLTAAPPVYRALDSAAVKIAPGSSWNHASAMRAYNDAQLASILAFLRASIRP